MILTCMIPDTALHAVSSHSSIAPVQGGAPFCRRRRLCSFSCVLLCGGTLAVLTQPTLFGIWCASCKLPAQNFAKRCVGCSCFRPDSGAPLCVGWRRGWPAPQTMQLLPWPTRSWRNSRGMRSMCKLWLTGGHLSLLTPAA